MSCALNAWKICGAKGEAKSRAGFWMENPLFKKSSNFSDIRPQVLILASMGTPSPKDPGAWDSRIEGQVEGSLSKSRRIRLAGGLFLSLSRVKTPEVMMTPISSSLPRHESRTSKPRIHAAGKTWADSPKAERGIDAVRVVLVCSFFGFVFITGTRPRTRTTGNHGTTIRCGIVVCGFARVLLYCSWCSHASVTSHSYCAVLLAWLQWFDVPLLQWGLLPRSHAPMIPFAMHRNSAGAMVACKPCSNAVMQ